MPRRKADDKAICFQCGRPHGGATLLCESCWEAGKPFRIESPKPAIDDRRRRGRSPERG